MNNAALPCDVHAKHFGWARLGALQTSALITEPLD
jgi:hypothetical protein